MKKKLGIINLLLMIAVILGISYQSLHAFTHHYSDHSKTNKTLTSEKKNNITNLEEDDSCPVCEFKFVSFIKTQLFGYTLYPPKNKIPYLLSPYTKDFVVNLNSFYLRGPPFLNIK